MLRRHFSVFTVLFVLLASAGRVAAQDPAADAIPEPLPEGPAFSPRGAFLRSLALPGWGQAYVEAPGRGAVYFAVTGGSMWMAFVARSQLRDARAEQEFMRETGRIEPDAETEFAIARARHFEDWAALSIFLVFLSAADAYVSAYLADFDQRIGVRPDQDGALRIEAQFPSAWLR